MNFKAEFIQICFRCTADFIQPSFHLGWSVSINRALLCLFFDLVTFCMHMALWFTSTIELKIKLLSPSLSAVPFSSCSRSWYREIATSSFPTSQASCRVSFPLVVHTPKSLEWPWHLFPRFVLRRATPIVTFANKSLRYHQIVRVGATVTLEDS